jgi:hypothetical protein
VGTDRSCAKMTALPICGCAGQAESRVPGQVPVIFW